MKKKITIYIFVCLFIVWNIIGIYSLINKKKDNPNNNNVDNTKVYVSYEDTSTFENEFILCRLKNYDFIKQPENIEDCTDEKYNIKTQTSNITYYDNSSITYNNKHYFVYSDNGAIKIYDTNNKKSINTNFTNIEYNPLSVLVKDSVIYGMVLENINNLPKKYVEYYSFKESKAFYKNKYNSVDTPKLLFNKYLIVYVPDDDNYKLYVLNTEKEEVLLELKTYEDDELIIYNNVVELNNDFAIINYSDNNKIISILYNSNFKKIDDNFDMYSETKDNNIIIEKNNVVYVYDKDGKQLKKIDINNNILSLINDYILVSENEKLSLIDLNNNKINLDIPFREIDQLQNIKNNYNTDKTISLTIVSEISNLDAFYEEYKKQNSETKYTKQKIEKCDLGYTYTYNIETKQLDKKTYVLCY